MIDAEARVRGILRGGKFDGKYFIYHKGTIEHKTESYEGLVFVGKRCTLGEIVS